MKRLFTILLIMLFVPQLVLAQNAIFDINNTPKLMATDGNSLTLGTVGDDSLYIRINETLVATWSSTGLSSVANLTPSVDGAMSIGTAALNFGDGFFGDGTNYVQIDEDAITGNATTGFSLISGGPLNLNSGANAGDDVEVNLAGASSDFFVTQDDGSTFNFQITQAGVWSSAAGLDLGIEYVTGANTACTTTCAVADGGALFGVDLAGGAAAPVIVEADDGTADACLCLELAA